MEASHTAEPMRSTFVAPPPMPEALPGTAAEQTPLEHAQHEELEFEPTEASASFRVDPVPPSEYRQAAPPAERGEDEGELVLVVEEILVVVPEAGTASVHTPEQPVSPEFEQAFAASGLPASGLQPEHDETSRVELPEPKHTITEFFHQEDAPVHQESAPSAAETVEPDVTSISSSGEMFSQPAFDAAAPEHEHAGEPVGHEGATAGAPLQQYFAPGDGDLEEEELVDDEEGDVLPSVAAHAQEEDFSEQETLEGAADLGTMLREMSIDEITRSEPLVGDDDEDFEEDFLEEDQDFDSEMASDETFEEEEGGETSLDETEDAAYASGFEGQPTESGAAPAAEVRQPAREPRREDGGRRDGRRGDRGRGRDGRGDRDRSGSSSSASSSDRGSDRSSDRSGSDRGSSRDSRGGRGSRQSMQTTNLPAISELLKPGQEILCQIAKEPIAKKGARITSHIALPGRFLVFMPTVSHTGVSRKIESDGERRRLKEILLSEKGDASGGFIVRTAAAGASEEELRSDLRFLLNLWTDIKTRSESSKSPALIYHDLNLVERVLRDQVTDNFSAIWVDTETEYERVLRFLQRFQPSLIRRVKLYTKDTPLFEQFGITEEINKALRSKVWLKSGGSIVINQTEALVAIDINTGKFVGKTARLEDTIVKTNLDAIPEIVRQIRLRDLGGIIIIDFIDMDERKNRNKVMAALEDELKSDRAPSKVLQFNDFGLVAITRKRVKQSLERTLSTTCGVCAGTGMVKSPVTVCNDIYVEMRKMHKNMDRGDVMLRVHPDVVKQLKAPSTHWLQEMEEMCGKTILVKSDPSLHPEQFDIH